RRIIMENVNLKTTEKKADEVVKNVTNTIDGKADGFKFKLADNLASAASAVHDRSDRAENVLTAGVDKAHDYAQNTVHKANVLAHKTADAIESTSGYVKEFKLAEAEEQLRTTVANRPGTSIAVAGLFGLTVGLM